MRTDKDENAATVIACFIAWLYLIIFYLYQSVVRTAPIGMMPELRHVLHLTPMGFTALYALNFYGFAVSGLIVGLAMDQFGPQRVLPVGAVLLGIGALLFATGDLTETSVGRVLQGVGGAFACIGAVYLAAVRLPPSGRAMYVGIVQMFGMTGALAGQFVVGPAIASDLAWNGFWSLMGFLGVAMAILLFVSIPAPNDTPRRKWAPRAWIAFRDVSLNPQSILCGLIAALLFLPTSLFDMVWGVRFLQEARNLPYEEAVMRSASVPIGWIIGCPMLGWISDRIGRRKPVIIVGSAFLFGCCALVLFDRLSTLPRYGVGLVGGIASGAAMLPYTVIKETNRPEYSGTAIGFLNFVNFTVAALLGPAFGILLKRSGNGGMPTLNHYQIAFTPMVYGVGLAIVLAYFLRETGPAPRPLKRGLGMR
jgi:MFS family permease